MNVVREELCLQCNAAVGSVRDAVLAALCGHAVGRIDGYFVGLLDTVEH